MLGLLLALLLGRAEVAVWEIKDSIFEVIRLIEVSQDDLHSTLWVEALTRCATQELLVSDRFLRQFYLTVDLIGDDACYFIFIVLVTRDTATREAVNLSNRTVIVIRHAAAILAAWYLTRHRFVVVADNVTFCLKLCSDGLRLPRLRLHSRLFLNFFDC